MKLKNKYLLLALFFCVFSFFQCSKPSIIGKPNILLICFDDLRPELKSFGAAYISSPNIDRLAENGVSFQKHFVNAPSGGPSRYTLLTGQYGPATNDALIIRANNIEKGIEVVDPSMPEWFRIHGYTTVSVGKVSHHPGGMGGDNWNDSTIIEMPNTWDKHLMPVMEWEHARGAMHGLAHGEIRKKDPKIDVFQTVEGDDNIYPDVAIANEVCRHYTARISYADAKVGKVLAELKRTGADKNTIVILWGDHGWHLNEHTIWGKHSLFEESLHSPMIIHYPGMKNKGVQTDAIVETLDIFPTLYELTGIEIPEFTHSMSLKTILDSTYATSHSAIAYQNNVTTIRTATHRMIIHKDGFIELYDHTTAEKKPKILQISIRNWWKS